MRTPRWLGAFGVLVLYCLTMSRDLSLFDSPELALVAYELGLGHPPGQPLYTLLGYLFAHLPGVPTLIGLNFMSALAGALTVIPACRIAERLSGDAFTRRQHALLVGVIVLGALHPVLWEPATRVEVYSLATLFAVWGLERVQAALHPSTPTTRVHPLIVGALLMGLSASVNPITALACAAAVTPVILSALFQRRISLKVFGLTIITGIAALLPYLYVPLIAERTDVLIWGAPDNRADLLNYLLGGDYAHNTGITLATWTAHATEWLAASNARFGILWLGIGAATPLFRDDRRGLGRTTCAQLVVLCVSLVCANQIFRIDNPDYHGYLAAPFWLCAACVAGFIVQLSSRPLVGSAIILVVFLAFSIAETKPTIASRSRSDDRLVRDLVETALSAAPRDSIVVVESDHWIAPALYLQRVENLRPDVVVLGAGLSGSSWYWNLIYRDHPDLKPFAIRGPGGRDARMQRFIASQPERPLQVEHLALGNRLGFHVCPGGALLSTGECGPSIDAAHDFARTLSAQLERSNDTVPLAQELTAMLSLQHGEDLWRLGAPNAALHVLLAGIPASMRRDITIDWDAVSRTPPLRRPPMQWQRQRVLGEPARNLFVAGELLFGAGQRDAASKLGAAASKEDLPEASQ